MPPNSQAYRRPQHAAGCAAILIVFASACADTPQSARSDSAGVDIVVSDDNGVWSDSDRPTLTEALRIGSQQDTLYQFGSIGGVDISSRGVIAVLDAQAGAIRLYDSTGKYLRSIGRSGQGPGELNRSVGDMVLSNGDTVLIANGARSSVTRLLIDGQSLTSFDIPDDESTSSVALDSRWQEHPHGGAVQQIIGRPRDSAEVYPPYHLVRLTASGAADTIFTLPGGRTIQPDDSIKKPRRNLAIEGGEMAHDGPMPEIRVFAPEPVWALTSDGAVHYAMTSEYAINMYDSAAVLKRIVRRPVKAQPLTASDKEEGLELFRKSMTEGGVPAGEVNEMLSSIRFADHFPVLIRMLGGPEGSLWVQRASGKIDFSAIALDEGMSAFASPRWDVFASDGTYMGEVSFPDRFVPARWVGDRLLGVAHDENQVEQVSIMRPQPDGVLRSLRRDR